MLAIQKRCRGARDEELTAVGVGPGVGHGEQTRDVVFVLKGLVGEATGGVLGEDGGGAGAVGVEEVTALDHEGFDLWRFRQWAVDWAWMTAWNMCMEIGKGGRLKTSHTTRWNLQPL